MIIGGNWNNGANAGSAALNVNNDLSNARDNIAAHNKATNRMTGTFIAHAFLCASRKSSKRTRRQSAGARAGRRGSGLVSRMAENPRCFIACM